MLARFDGILLNDWNNGCTPRVGLVRDVVVELDARGGEWGGEAAGGRAEAKRCGFAADTAVVIG